MNKILFLLLAGASSIFGFEKLDSKYWVQYGKPDAEVKAVEYISLSCPKCLELFKEDFPKIKEKFIDSGRVSWVYHLDPADLLTLQAMVCLEQLSEEQKPLFFASIVENLPNVKDGCHLMQAAMETFGKPIPDLGKVEFLEKSQAFQDAFQFVRQEDVITVIPTLEIDGVIYKEFPSAEFIDSKLSNPKRSK
jgi:hypothetical protein